MDRLHVFGVRHHGPGCARSLVAALEAADPSIVLVEGPAEATSALTHAQKSTLVPPVALLVYAEKAPKHASFIPFAVWSPEWQAIRWALRNNRLVRFIDLPARHGLAAALEREKTAARAPPSADQDPAEDAEERDPARRTTNQETERPGLDEDVGAIVRRDPLGALARIAGQTDGETWWNQLIEEQTHAPEIFAAIEAAMTVLRGTSTLHDHPEARREAQREAHMRLECARALDTTDGPVAAVVGAWHVPALRTRVKAADDRALLAGLPTTKVAVTWVPWTYTRLARASGYGAGVVAPGWYDHLWSVGRALPPRGAARAQAIVTGWLVQAARLLREAGLDASPASLIEAQRLATAIAAIDEVSLPGLDTLTEAMRATVLGGDDRPLELIEKKLLIGSTVGSVGDDIPQNPLAEDLARQQKATRMKPEALERALSLDLRSDIGLSRSILLHRLTLLGVPWGLLEGAGRSRGTFRENWKLRWDPELSVSLAENLIHGTSIEAAAGNRAIAEASEGATVSALAELVQACLLADLEEAARRCVERLQSVATTGGDVPGLMAAVSPLASVLRYGTARKVPVEALSLLVRSLVEQAVAGLAHASRNLDDETAENLLRELSAFDQALALLEEPSFVADLDDALVRVAEDPQAAAILQGYSVRRLHDRARFGRDETASHLARALSPTVDPKRATTWLEGFLARSGGILLHDASLLGIIDEWLTGIDGKTLIELLPLVRRAFATLSPADRRLLMHRVRAGRPTSGSSPEARDPVDPAAAAAFETALPLLRTILGWEKDA